MYYPVAIFHNLGGNAKSITEYKDLICNQLFIDPEYLIAITDILPHCQILGKILENNKVAGGKENQMPTKAIW